MFLKIGTRCQEGLVADRHRLKKDRPTVNFIKTFYLALNGATTFSITTRSITTFSMLTIAWRAYLRWGQQHYVSRAFKLSVIMLCVVTFYCNAECHDAECRYSVCICWVSWHPLTLCTNKLECLKVANPHALIQGILKGKYQCTIDLLFDWLGISCMTTDNFCFYLQNRQFQTSQTGGQQHSDTSPFSIMFESKASHARKR